MRKGNKKSSPEEVKEMRKLYQEGWGFNAIGRKFKRDHSTIMYWIKKGDWLPKRILSTGKEDKRGGIRTKPEKPKRDPALCLFCQKLKVDLRWKLTQFCQAKCWDANYLNN